MGIDYWNNSDSGDWSTASNWSRDTVPTLGDLAVISTGTAIATSLGTLDTPIYLNGGAGLTLNNTSLGFFSPLVSNAGSGTNVIDLTNRAPDGNTNGQSNNLNGAVLAISGTTDISIAIQSITINNGLIAVASLSKPDSISIGAGGGGFANNGAMVSGPHGSLTLFFGTNPGEPQDVPNNGLMEAVAGGTFTVDTGTLGTEYLGNLVNDGEVVANDGTFDISASVTQGSTGVVDITNHGTLNLDGPLDGGTVKIDNSTLNFGTLGFLGSSDTLDLLGNTDTLTFAEPVRTDFNPTTNTLAIFQSIGNTNQQIASYQLGGSTTYNNANFTSFGTVVTFNAHPST